MKLRGDNNMIMQACSGQRAMEKDCRYHVSHYLRTVIFDITAAIVLICISTSSHAATGRIDITIIKSKSATEMFGNLFFGGRRYRLAVTGINTEALGATKVYLDGVAPDLRSPGDVVGTYKGAETETAVVAAETVARLENEEGVILEIHGINLGNMSVNLSGMTINSRGWRAKVTRGFYSK